MGKQKDKPIITAPELQPKEQLMAVSYEKKSHTIGIPRELFFQEKRVALVPSAVAALVEAGHRVLVERQAGTAANFPDLLYSEAGAEIVDSSAEVWQADIIAKIVPPALNEIKMMKDRAILISALHISGQKAENIRAMMAKKITALSYEHIRDKSNTHPVLHSISEITGNTAILIGAEYLSDNQKGRGKMLGGFTGINPSEVVILGAGTVGEFAARAALGFGALVKVFDYSLYKLLRIQNNLSNRIYTSIIQPDVLSKALQTADVVIGALYPRPGQNSHVITEKMIQSMKTGSVLVDVSIDKGGCSETSRETTHTRPVYQLHGVTHYCVPNIASRTPHTASYALSNYIGPFIHKLCEPGGLLRILNKDLGIRNGTYLYNGLLVMEEISTAFNIPWSNLDLLLMAY